MINARRTSLSRRASLETAAMQPRTYYAKMQSPDNRSGVIVELNLTYLYSHGGVGNKMGMRDRPGSRWFGIKSGIGDSGWMRGRSGEKRSIWERENERGKNDGGADTGVKARETE